MDTKIFHLGCSDPNGIRCVSDFQIEPEKLMILPEPYNGCCVVFLYPHEKLFFYGRVFICVKRGKVNIHGYCLDSSCGYYSVLCPFSSSCLCIEEASEEFYPSKLDCSIDPDGIQCSDDFSIASIGDLRSHVGYSYEDCAGIEVNIGNRETIAERFIASSSILAPTVILLCGFKQDYFQQQPHFQEPGVAVITGQDALFFPPSSSDSKALKRKKEQSQQQTKQRRRRQKKKQSLQENEAISSNSTLWAALLQTENIFGVPGFFPIFHDYGLPGMVISHQWKGLRNLLCAVPLPSEAPKILICGGKNVGKSTLARYLLNSLLNCYSTVAFLECDIGQCEFTPPGMVSIHLIRRPVFGPPWTHLRNPLRMFFIGSTSCKENSYYYLSCILELFRFYERHFTLKNDNQNFEAADTVPLDSLENVKQTEDYHREKYNSIPLIVNTQGWMKGIGIDLLRELIEKIRPHHIVHIRSSKEAPISFNMEANLKSPISNDSVDHNLHSLDAIVTFPTVFSLNALERRMLQLNSYFGNTVLYSGSLPVYKVPWSRLRIRILNQDVYPSQILFALNASLVGLAIDLQTPLSSSTIPCTVPRSPNKATRKLQCNARELPILLNDTPLCDCVGMGIICSIDIEEKIFFISTSIPYTKLRAVNTILKGDIELPYHFLFSKAYENKELKTFPYMVDGSLIAAEGSGSIETSVRHNIKRKSHSNPRKLLS